MDDLDTLVNNYKQMVQELHAAPAEKSSEKPDYFSMRQEITDQGGSPGDRVVSAAHLLVDSGNTDGKFCWDFAFLCYFLATAVPDSTYNAPPWEGKVCGTHHAGPNELSKIIPGTFLYINNQNTSDVKGNHSVIVLSTDSKTATVASLWQPHQVPHIHTVNFYEPKGFVVFIGRPTAASPTNPWFNYMKTR